MGNTDRSVLRTSAILGVVVAVVAVAVVAGFVVADDDPSGAGVLNEIEDRYAAADSVLIDAVVTLDGNETDQRVNVSMVGTRSGQLRVNVSNGTDYAAFGHTENTTWIDSSRMKTSLVRRNGSIVGQPAAMVDLNVSQRLANVTDGNATRPSEQAAETLPVAWENLTVSRVLEQTNASAEFVESTNVAGEQVDVVSVSDPDAATNLTVWATADTATVVKYRVSSLRVTMTINVTETRFNVSPADRTFRPPTTERWSTEVETREELRGTVAGPIALPSDRWSFEHGGLVSSPVTGVASVYTSTAATLSLFQTSADDFAAIPGDGRQVAIGSRTVTVWEPTNETILASWSEANRTIVVAADVPEADLLNAISEIELVTEDS